MAVTEAYSMSAVTVSTSEISFVSGTTTLQNNTTAGVYQLLVDAANMAKGDEFLIKVKEKVKSAGTQRVVFQATLSDAQTEIFTMPPMMFLHGWDMTIIKVAGTDRAFDGSVRKG